MKRVVGVVDAGASLVHAAKGVVVEVRLARPVVDVGLKPTILERMTHENGLHSDNRRPLSDVFFREAGKHKLFRSARVSYDSRMLFKTVFSCKKIIVRNVYWNI